jgi:predicted nucleic-acid-binding Zn-ribbon protein
MDDRISLRSGKCPMCGSDEVYENTETASNGDSGKVAVGMWGTKKITLIRYLCADCGYVETYVDNLKDREKAREHWKSVNPK